MNFPSNYKFSIYAGLLCCFNFTNAQTPLLDKQSKDKTIFTHQCAVETELLTSKSKPNTIVSNRFVPNAIYLEADTGNIRSTGISTLSGDVIIQQNSTLFNADSAQVNRETSNVKANGNVIFSDTNFALESQSINYNLDDKTGTIDNAKYSIGTEGVHGKSSKITQLDKNNLTLKDATFSSCPATKQSWHFASGNISLNRETQIGTAKHMTFNVGDVPIFYFPWLKFPINNQRISGFLSPSIRLQTNAGISIPYYFNLAPNFDATVRLTTLRNRGIKVDNEFRYLSNKHAGVLEYNFIPNDQSFGDQSRDYFKINHRTIINAQSRISLEAEGVSDQDFFDDFSTSLESSTRPALQRRLEYSNHIEPWIFTTALEDYQIFDSSDDPYSKLPEIKLSYKPKTAPKDLTFSATSELTYFDKDNSVTGTRGDVKFKIGKKWGDEAWYFKPSMSLQHSFYALNNNNDVSSLNRTLPTVTLDSGLFFDRELKSNKYTQTLEPRLFYTYTPYKDQSSFPVFDTAVANFSESNQLFLENRFTGKDRIADTNQITFAVSSRIQDREDGKELFKATIGQVFNFTDRKVTLPGGTILTGKRSDLLLELSGRLNDNFRLASTVNLKSDNKSIENYDLRLNYQDDNKRIANLSFRKLNTELEQISFSAASPINDKWSMVASIDHDTDNDRNLESLLGLEYQDCCWKTRLVVKRYLTSDNINYENPVFLEFELKGLGNIGTSATRQIKEKIYGYDDF